MIQGTPILGQPPYGNHGLVGDKTHLYTIYLEISDGTIFLGCVIFRICWCIFSLQPSPTRQTRVSRRLYTDDISYTFRVFPLFYLFWGCYKKRHQVAYSHNILLFNVSILTSLDLDFTNFYLFGGLLYVLSKFFFDQQFPKLISVAQISKNCSSIRQDQVSGDSPWESSGGHVGNMSCFAWGQKKQPQGSIANIAISWFLI